MSVPAPVRIGRAMEAALEAAVADLALPLPVQRERAAPLDAKTELPAVLVYEDGLAIEAEFIGGGEIRTALFTVEVVADAETREAAHDMASVLRERCRAALIADRTLGCACLSLDVDLEAAPRSEQSDASNAKALAFGVRAYHT